jgi:tryptophan 2,3-dioxygenase
MALSDFEKYIRPEELLALQKAPADLTCHDEMQFQIVHQAAELWMKLAVFELRRFVELRGKDELVLASATLKRRSGAAATARAG